MTLIDLSERWRATAERIRHYNVDSPIAETLKACAVDLEAAIADDLGTWVPVELASRLLGEPKAKLRRWAAQGHPIARKGGNGRWLYNIQHDPQETLVPQNGRQGLDPR